MSRFRLIMVAVVIWGAAILYGLWPQLVPPPTTIPVKEVHQTRGPSQETPEDRALHESMERLSHETPPFAVLEAGVTFNGEIPLWGLILAIIAAIVAFIRLETRMSTHQDADTQAFATVDKQFKATDKLLDEVRMDVKKLLIHSGVED